MKVYLVGGAVRDELLGYPIQERDWVVVGARPADLHQLGYQQVGRDFPVFLHPQTREEYALARTERKTAPGYYGFHCDFNPHVTLEEDLARRDLTINAMAKDEQGRIIDPFNGQEDLKNKVLRHVSPAFAEDPVRVLRLARFAARFAHLEFKLAEETRELVYRMVKQGELKHLVAERVWQEWQRSLGETTPEAFIQLLRTCGALQAIIPEVDHLFGVPNPSHHHKEIDSGIHSLMVLHEACVLSNDPVVRFAAFMHDLGKAATPIQEWPAQHGHDEAGVMIIERLCDRLRVPTEYRLLAKLAARFHLIIHRLKQLKPATIVNVFVKTDAFRRRQLFENLLLVCQADAQGKRDPVVYHQAAEWRLLLDACLEISPKPFIEAGLKGEAIKAALRQQQIACVKQVLSHWD